MRLLKLLGILAAICAACVAFLVVTTGWQSVVPPGHKYAFPARLGEEIGRWVFIYGVSAVVAAVGFALNRKNLGIRYPGLTIGIIVAIALTGVLGR